MSKGRNRLVGFLNKMFMAIASLAIGFIFSRVIKFSSIKSYILIGLLIILIIILQYIICSRDEKILKHFKSKFFYIVVFFNYILYYIVLAVLSYFVFIYIK